MARRKWKCGIDTWSDRKVHQVAGSLRRAFIEGELTLKQAVFLDRLLDELDWRRRRNRLTSCAGCDLCVAPF